MNDQKQELVKMDRKYYFFKNEISPISSSMLPLTEIYWSLSWLRKLLSVTSEKRKYFIHSNHQQAIFSSGKLINFIALVLGSLFSKKLFKMQVRNLGINDVTWVCIIFKLFFTFRRFMSWCLHCIFSPSFTFGVA